jgi:hypothetical protein
MKQLLFSLIMITSVSLFAQNKDKIEINKFIDQWHQDAANADMEAYFDKIDLMKPRSGPKRNFMNGRSHVLKMAWPGISKPLIGTFIWEKTQNMRGLMNFWPFPVEPFGDPVFWLNAKTSGKYPITYSHCLCRMRSLRR